jgi:hypothetical protein
MMPQSFSVLYNKKKQNDGITKETIELNCFIDRVGEIKILFKLILHYLCMFDKQLFIGVLWDFFFYSCPLFRFT